MGSTAPALQLGNKKTAVIMQPTYLPWSGYFDLMDQCDIFIFLDSVQFDKRSWQQRNRIKTAQGEMWLTVPVLSKGKFDQKICEVRIDSTASFFEKHLKTIHHAYCKTPFYHHYIAGLKEVLFKGHEQLAELNIELIGWVKENLGIRTEFARASKLKGSGQKVDLLVSLCREVEASRYISPPGSKEYIDENNLFLQHDIELAYHQYHHPEYPQLHEEFLPYMSVLDLLFHHGPESLKIIRQGRSGL